MPTPSHGTLIAVELDPTGAPNVWTTIAEITGEVAIPEFSRPETDATSHNGDIDLWVPGVLQRGPLTFSVNFLNDNQTHDHLTGTRSAILNSETRGYRIRMPGGTSNVKEFIGSGFVTSFKVTAPAVEGVISADITIRFSGPMKIDGVVFGTPIA